MQLEANGESFRKFMYSTGTIFYHNSLFIVCFVVDKQIPWTTVVSACPLFPHLLHFALSPITVPGGKQLKTPPTIL